MKIFRLALHTCGALAARPSRFLDAASVQEEHSHSEQQRKDLRAADAHNAFAEELETAVNADAEDDAHTSLHHYSTHFFGQEVETQRPDASLSTSSSTFVTAASFKEPTTSDSSLSSGIACYLREATLLTPWTSRWCSCRCPLPSWLLRTCPARSSCRRWWEDVVDSGLLLYNGRGGGGHNHGTATSNDIESDQYEPTKWYLEKGALSRPPPPRVAIGRVDPEDGAFAAGISCEVETGGGAWLLTEEHWNEVLERAAKLENFGARRRRLMEEKQRERMQSGSDVVDTTTSNTMLNIFGEDATAPMWPWCGGNRDASPSRSSDESITVLDETARPGPPRRRKLPHPLLSSLEDVETTILPVAGADDEVEPCKMKTMGHEDNDALPPEDVDAPLLWARPGSIRTAGPDMGRHRPTNFGVPATPTNYGELALEAYAETAAEDGLPIVFACAGRRRDALGCGLRPSDLPKCFPRSLEPRQKGSAVSAAMRFQSNQRSTIAANYSSRAGAADETESEQGESGGGVRLRVFERADADARHQQDGGCATPRTSDLDEPQAPRGTVTQVQQELEVEGQFRDAAAAQTEPPTFAAPHRENTPAAASPLRRTLGAGGRPKLSIRVEQMKEDGIFSPEDQNKALAGAGAAEGNFGDTDVTPKLIGKTYLQQDHSELQNHRPQHLALDHVGLGLGTGSSPASECCTRL